MSWLWLLFASLTVAGSLAYNVSMKAAAGNGNVFGYSLIMAAAALAAQAVCFFIAKYGFHVDVLQGVDARNVRLAVLCGVSTAAINLFYFLALRYGSLMSSQLMWTVGGTVAILIFSALFLGETLTPTKFLGLILGLTSVVLIVKQS